MNDLNNVPKTGTFGNAVDEINSNFELVETAISQLESRTSKFAGFFQDAAALEATIPSPTVGMWADVGSTKIIYRCNTAGTWTETEETDSISASVSYDVVNNLTSTSTTKALSAKQGKVLNDALDSLKAAGYVFAGVTSPSASISTPSEKVFYLAPAGTYANFGSSYTVGDGEIGVFSYNGSWSHNKIVISIVEAGYRLMGVANPTTVPNVQEGQKSFYISRNAGVYTNFNNIAIKKNNDSILLWDGSAWSSQSTKLFRDNEENYGLHIASNGYAFIKDGVFYWSGIYIERADNGANIHLSDGVHAWDECNSITMNDNYIYYCTGISGTEWVLQAISMSSDQIESVFQQEMFTMLVGDSGAFQGDTSTFLGKAITRYMAYESQYTNILPNNSRFDSNSYVNATNVGMWALRFTESSSITEHGSYKTVVIQGRSESSYPCIWIYNLLDKYAGRDVVIEFWIKGTTGSGTITIGGSEIDEAKNINYTTNWGYARIKAKVTTSGDRRVMLYNSSENAISVDIKDVSVKVLSEDYKSLNAENKIRKLNLVMGLFQTSSQTEPFEFNYNGEYGQKFWCTPKFIKKVQPYVLLSCNEFFETSILYYDKDFNGVTYSTSVGSDANNKTLINLLDYPYYRFYFQKRINGTRTDFKPTIYIEGAGDDICAKIKDVSSLKFKYNSSMTNENFPDMGFVGTPESYSWLPLTIPVNVTDPYCTDGQTATVQDSGALVYDYGWLALPATYSNLGEPTRLIIWCHGSSMHYTIGDKVINTGRMGADPSYWLSEGYAVMDMEGSPFGYETGTTRFPHDCIPAAYECYKAGYEFVVNTFNICKDGVLLGGRSLGGKMAMDIVSKSGIPVIAACLNAPAFVNELNSFKSRNAARRAYVGYYKGFSPTGSLSSDETYWGTGNLTDAQLAFMTENKDDFLKYAVFCKLYEDYPSWEDMVSVANVNTLSSNQQTRERDVNAVIAVYGNAKAKSKVPVKIFCSPSDITVNYLVGASLLYRNLWQGGSITELRLFPAWDNPSDEYYGEPANTGHPFDLYVGNRVATFTNGRGIALTNVPIAYIEALRFWRRYENNLK